MEIQYLGHSSFYIKTKEATICCDPYSAKNEMNLKFPTDLKPDIVTVSHDHLDHNGVGNFKNIPYIVKEPGEFEVRGVNFYGISSFHDNEQGAKRGQNTIFVIEAEGFSVCHLGDLGHQLDTEQLNEISEIDVLLVPVGGTYTLNAKEAVQVINQIEPKFVIPMHFLTPGSKFQLETVDPLIKELGVTSTPMDKLVLKNREELPEEMQVVLLNKR